MLYNIWVYSYNLSALLRYRLTCFKGHAWQTFQLQYRHFRENSFATLPVRMPQISLKAFLLKSLFGLWTKPWSGYMLFLACSKSAKIRQMAVSDENQNKVLFNLMRSTFNLALGSSLMGVQPQQNDTALSGSRQGWRCDEWPCRNRKDRATGRITARWAEIVMSAQAKSKLKGPTDWVGCHWESPQMGDVKVMVPVFVGAPIIQNQVLQRAVCEKDLMSSSIRQVAVIAYVCFARLETGG